MIPPWGPLRGVQVGGYGRGGLWSVDSASSVLAARSRVEPTPAVIRRPGERPQAFRAQHTPRARRRQRKSPSWARSGEGVLRLPWWVGLLDALSAGVFEDLEAEFPGVTVRLGGTEVVEVLADQAVEVGFKKLARVVNGGWACEADHGGPWGRSWVVSVGKGELAMCSVLKCSRSLWTCNGRCQRSWRWGIGGLLRWRSRTVWRLRIENRAMAMSLRRGENLPVPNPSSC